MTNPISAPASGAPTALSPGLWWVEFAALFHLGWPLIIAQLAQNALMFTDVMMMGWLGPKFVAAGAIATAFFFCFQVFAMGVVNAVAPMASQALGAKDFRSVRRTVRQGLWIGIILAALMLPIVWFSEPLLIGLGQNRDLAKMAGHFLHFAVWLMFPAFAILVVRSFLAAHGSTHVILFIAVAGVLLNAVLNYALMLGNWGFPRLELAGSGISTTIVNIVMLSLMLLYVRLHRRYKRYHILARFFKPDWPRFFELWRIGTPIGLMLLAEVALFTAAALLQGWLGANEVAAHAVAMQFGSLAFMVPLGLSQATTVRVGRAYGAGNRPAIGITGWTSLGATLIFMTLTCITFLAVPGTLAAIFLSPSKPENLIPFQLAISYLAVCALFQLVDGAQVSLGAALRGLSDTRMPLLLALIGYWLVGFPISYLLGFTFHMRGVGIWLGLAAGLAAVAIALVIRFAMRERLGLTQPKRFYVND